jgi:tetratricopeptide (TPR) repeat protein
VNIQKQLKKSQDLIRLGQLDSAINALQSALKKFPKQFQVHDLLGMAYAFKNNYSDAEKHFKLSLSSNFNIQAAKNLITLLIQQKRWQEAFPWSQRLNENFDDELNIMLNHALILRNTGKENDALDVYKVLLNKHPQNINIYISYGFTLNYLEKFQEAVDIYLQGMEVKSDDFGILYNLGITYLNQFDYSNALKYLLLAQEQNNKSIDLLLTIAVCYAKKRDFDAAYHSVDQAKKLEPNNLLIPFQMGTLLMQQDKNEMALQYFDEVIKLKPNHIEANYHKGLVLLKEEKYKEAFQYYRYRVIRKNNKFGFFDDFEIPKINKDSEILVSWEQGIGDEILNMALLNDIKNKVKSVAYITQDKLIDWFRLNLPDVSFIAEKDSKEYIKENTHKKQLNIATLMSYIDDWDSFFKTPISWKASEAIKEKYKTKYKTNNEKIVGISWRSANKKIGDEKSISLSDMLPILKNNKIISLQYGDVKQELEQINSQEKINIFYDQELDYYNDINSLAALISICDEVVTCSNVTAHIAGRLGVKTHLMIPKSNGTIWYWNSKSEYSKWYPSVKIYRQIIDRDWSHLIQKINLEGHNKII